MRMIELAAASDKGLNTIALARQHDIVTVRQSEITRIVIVIFLRVTLDVNDTHTSCMIRVNATYTGAR